MRLSAEAYRSWKFKEQGLPHDLVARYAVQHTFSAARTDVPSFRIPDAMGYCRAQRQWVCLARSGKEDTIGKRTLASNQNVACT